MDDGSGNEIAGEFFFGRARRLGRGRCGLAHECFGALAARGDRPADEQDGGDRGEGEQQKPRRGGRS